MRRIVRRNKNLPVLLVGWVGRGGRASGGWGGEAGAEVLANAAASRRAQGGALPIMADYDAQPSLSKRAIASAIFWPVAS
jgi:hypothetical protein